ncbi:MAG: hypothetical protein U0892_08860 [Pirellulales bacterium]
MRNPVATNLYAPRLIDAIQFVTAGRSSFMIDILAFSGGQEACNRTDDEGHQAGRVASTLGTVPNDYHECIPL